ncbi:MAG: class I SAM-dependent methyltransferase, partial [Nanoarchaeota archaeon]
MISIRKSASKSTNYEKHTTKNPVGKLFLNNFLNTVIKTIRPLNIDSVLDVGCGEGFTLARLQKEKIGKDYEGIERDGAAIELGSKLYPRLKITKGDIYKLPFKNNSFDLIVCTEVLEHLDNPRKAYKELIRV